MIAKHALEEKYPRPIVVGCYGDMFTEQTAKVGGERARAGSELVPSYIARPLPMPW